MKTVNKEEAAMRSEYDFSKGQRGRYVDRIKPGDTDAHNCKVSVTIHLDANIVQHLKQRAMDSGISLEAQINVFLRDHVELSEQSDVGLTVDSPTDGSIPTSAERHLAKARGYVSHAKEFQDREIYWAAWDDAYRAISEALSAVLAGHEREKDNVAFAMTERLDRINTARNLGILSEQQCWRAQLIIERVPESYKDSMSVEDSKEAILAAEEIIKTVEQQIENQPD